MGDRVSVFVVRAAPGGVDLGPVCPGFVAWSVYACFVVVLVFDSEFELRARLRSCDRLEPACYGRCSGLRCLLLLFCCTLLPLFFALVFNTQHLVFALPCPFVHAFCFLWLC